MSKNIDIAKTLDKMTEALRPHLEHNPLMIGIHSGGVWVAEHLHRKLGLDEPLGTLDISFYRDDFTRIGMNPQVKTSDLSTSVEGRYIILVDDVLHTGRTIRAAMNEIFDYGRPDTIVLACLIERDGHELPIRADVAGESLTLKANEHIKLVRDEKDGTLSLTLQEASG
ncbi:MAG: bifunctional pyr operon transcriptional regulator/uracil phosphoribosyltransferase PyrR [Proteobacteria bacterium]|nr:bifunctional pyr operon transcriptional regulator/uracil phosphoribosyltransferase PyrR [Pseudomonadota bacterium]